MISLKQLPYRIFVLAKSKNIIILTAIFCFVRGAVRLSFFLLLWTAIFNSSLRGEIILPDKNDYLQTFWTTDDGLPQGSILSVAQTSDDYLWVGTFNGLARFDGVDFTVFNSINTPELKSNYIFALLADRQGNLWIGTEDGGLVRRTGEQFFYYSTAGGLLSNTIYCLLEDRAGDIWLGTNRGLNRLRDGQFAGFTAADGLPDDIVSSLAEDADGALWVGTEKGLARFENGRFTAHLTNEDSASQSVLELYRSPTRGLLVGTGKGLKRWQDGRLIGFAGQGELAAQRVIALGEDRSGDLWIRTVQQGLYRWRRNAAAPEKILDDAVPDERFNGFYFDADGNLWLGTVKHELVNFQKERFRGFGSGDGFADKSIWSFFETGSGDLWASDSARFYRRLPNGTVKIYAPPEELRNIFNSAAEDRDGGLWFGGDGGFARFANERFVEAWTNKDGLSGSRILSLLGDRHGNLWLGTEDDGINRFRDGQFKIYTTEQGLADNRVSKLLEDRSGAIWVGTLGGVSRIRDEQIASWKFGEGAASNAVLSFYEDRARGALWIGTSGGGLYRYQNDRFVNVTSRDGLYEDLAFTILESGGDLWMSGNKGVSRVSLEQLNDFADGRRAAVDAYHYDTADGMPAREATGASPAGWKTRDGFLWFATIKGMARAEPQMIDSRPPRVFVERATLGDEPRPVGETLEIAPGQENLEIKYTAISWQRPKHIRFKYRLENLDGEWTSAGTRRTAYFPYLPPGEYTFRVIADNGEGVWDETGASLQIRVLPPFYRTWWFLAACCLAAGALGFAIYRRRVNQLERARGAQEEFSRRLIQAHETERRRIAAELHDSIGQSLAMIKNSAVFGSQTIGDLAEAKDHLAEISTQSAQAISEVREIAYNLRPFMLDRLGLTKAVSSLLNKIADNTSFKVTAEIENIDELFEREAEISIYRVIQECLNNVLKHSGAKRVEVKIAKKAHGILIKVADDGRGFDSKTINETGTQGGFGLLGIAERVRMLRGTFDVDSAVGQGAKITIEVWTQK